MKKHILLVDDDKDELHIFIEALDMAGVPYKCTWAKSGEQAISQLQYLAPDIVFLDLNMPGMDGFDTIRRIKELQGGYPVVMYSTGMNEEASAKALSFGAASCLRKPDTITGLVTALRPLLGG